MAKPEFIKFYRSIWDDTKIKSLKDSSFRFLIYILFKSYRQRENKLIFKLKPKEIYSEFNTSHSKLWRIQQDLAPLKIKIEYLHKKYIFDLTEFFNIYYPKCIKNETVDENSCS